MLVCGDAVGRAFAGTPPSTLGLMTSQSPVQSTRMPIEVWSDLLEGNRRFAAGKAIHPAQSPTAREDLIHGQAPEAAVLACADSRVPPELVFDAGLGELFDIRTAGEVLDDAVIASLEYAVEHLHVKVLAVLGHEGCGAVKAAVEGLDSLANDFDDCDCFAHSAEVVGEVADPDRADRVAAGHDDHLESLLARQDSPIVREVGESIRQARQADLDEAEDFERAHVARTIELIVDRSEPIRMALAEGRLAIAGARYLLTTGLVEVLSF